MSPVYTPASIDGAAVSGPLMQHRHQIPLAREWRLGTSRRVGRSFYVIRRGYWPLARSAVRLLGELTEHQAIPDEPECRSVTLAYSKNKCEIEKLSVLAATKPRSTISQASNAGLA
jgi:hypothetical protein